MSIFWSFISFIGIFLFVFALLYVIKHIFFFIKNVILPPVPNPNAYTDRQVLLLGLALTFIITFLIV